MKKAFLLIPGIMLLLPIFAGTQQAASFYGDEILDAKKDVIRVMTYNVHHCNPPSVPGKIDVEAIAKVIREANPDLVALQEIDVFTNRSGKTLHEARELARLTGMYSFFGKAIDFQGGEYGIAILSKFPLVDSAVYALPMKEGIGGEPRALATVTVEVKKGKKVLFACSHLELKVDNRLLQVQQIRSLLADKTDVIMAADFNDEPGSEAIRYMDDFLKRSCTENCPLTYPEIDPTKEIDMIFFTPAKFKVKSHRVIKESYASDHLPVLTELSFL